MVNTTVTASPNPIDDLKSFEIAINEHIPKKLESNILLVNTDAKNNVIGPIVGAIISIIIPPILRVRVQEPLPLLRFYIELIFLSK